MKNRIFIVLLIVTISVFGQEKTLIKKGKIILPVKKELTLKVTIKKEKIKKFELISENDLFEPSEFMNSMDEKPDNFDDMYIKFNKSDFGILLTVIHKLDKPIIYKAKIKIKGRDGFMKTSIHPCYPNVVSVEQWQDEIELIELYDFEFITE